MKKLEPCIKMGKKNRKIDDAEIEEHEFQGVDFFIFRAWLRKCAR